MDIEHVVRRIKAEFLEMPGLRLTVQQASRLWGLERALCESAINSIITLKPHALEDAARLDEQFKQSGFVGPLHGIPLVVKDEIDTAGMPTTLGTLVFKDYRPPQDSFVVDRPRKAGAIVFAKT